jgi:hypothetical protein
MVPVGARPATLATGRGGRRQSSREDEALLPAAATSSVVVGPGDEDGGAVRAADAAPPVVLEEADPGRAPGADVAVAAPADGHPLEGLRAHAAALGFGVVGDVDHDGVAFLGAVGLSHDQITCDRATSSLYIRQPTGQDSDLPPVSELDSDSDSIGRDSKSTRTAPVPYARSGRHHVCATWMLNLARPGQLPASPFTARD